MTDWKKNLRIYNRIMNVNEPFLAKKELQSPTCQKCVKHGHLYWFLFHAFYKKNNLQFHCHSLRNTLFFILYAERALKKFSTCLKTNFNSLQRFFLGTIQIYTKLFRITNDSKSIFYLYKSQKQIKYRD